jgi:hypothetical protein
MLHGAYRVAGFLGQHGLLSIGRVGKAVKNEAMRGDVRTSGFGVDFSAKRGRVLDDERVDARSLPAFRDKLMRPSQRTPLGSGGLTL